MELQDVHSKLDALLARIPLDFQIQGPDPLRPPYAPVASLPPPLHGTSVASHGTTPQPLPSNLNNPDLLTVVPRATGTHRCMAGDKMRTLRLGNGYVIAFTAQDVPPPPTTTFTDNIPRLNSMWDDTSMYWDQDSVLKILGHPIALVYWPIIYTRWKAGDWDTLKTQFGHWKVCYLLILPAAFSFIC